MVIKAKSFQNGTNNGNASSSSSDTQKKILFLLVGMLVGLQIDRAGSLAPFMTTTTSTTTTTKTTTYWCIVSKVFVSGTSAKYFSHFPHAAEALLPCWSWFQKMNATATSSPGRKSNNNHCGFAFMDGLNLKGNQGNDVSWQQQLVDGMGCKVKLIPNYVSTKATDQLWNLTPTIQLPLDADQLWNLQGNSIHSSSSFENDDHDGDDASSVCIHIPNLLLLKPRFPMVKYLEREEDAHALRQRFVSDDEIYELKYQTAPHHHDPRTTTIHVGLLQRVGRRAVTNLDEIGTALRERIPNAVVHTTTLNTPSLKEQATWFATKDVIVAAHGAALTNSLFITKGTIVLQIYPHNWFWQSLDWLIEQSGGIALDWYETGIHPVVEFESAKRSGSQNVGRESNITPPVWEIVEKLQLALSSSSSRSATTTRQINNNHTRTIPTRDAIHKLRGYQKGGLRPLW